jgi:hypothetical protein
VEVVASPHRLRLAIGAWELVDSTHTLGGAPSALGPNWRFSASRTSLTSSFAQALATVTALDARPDQVPEAAHAMLDDPDSSLAAILAGRQLHCYNVDIAVTRLLSRQGIVARMWDMDGLDGLGGNGHNLLEIWDAQAGSWFAFDPYYRCYFAADSAGAPLSFIEVRQRALAHSSALTVVHFLREAPTRPGADLIEEYRQLSPMSSVHSNNDFRWRYDHRYGVLQPFASVIDKLPLRYARGLRTLMIGGEDVRYVIHDRYTPDYAFRSVPRAFRLLLLAAVLLLGIDVYLGLRGRWRQRRRRKLAAIAAGAL